MPTTVKQSSTQTEEMSESASALAEAPASYGCDVMLNTEEAAKRMHCSRAYVAMLIDAAILSGGKKSPDGQRKVPESSIQQWIEDHPARDKLSVDETDYRKAATYGGMYEIPDEIYLNAAKRNRKSAN